MALSNANGFIGAGDVYIRPINADGTFGKRVALGNTTKFAIKPAADIKQQKSKGRDTYGQVLETAALQQPAELSMVLETVNRVGLRYAFMGDDAVYSQTASTVVAEAFVAQLDGWVQLSKENLDVTGVVIKNQAGTTTYVEGTDYVVNRRLGMVKAITGGTITDAQALTAGFSALAFTGARIRGNVRPQIKAELLLDGKNQVDDSIGILRVWQVTLAPTGEFDWFSDDFNTIDFAGQLTTPSGKTEPFVFDAR